MVITESVTIIGAGQNQTVLYGWANGANAGSEYGQQDTIYVMGDDVTIRNLSVQPMAQLPVPSTTYSYNKAIEVYGNNVTIENVTIGLYNLGIPEGADIGQETYGGSIYFNSAGTKDLSATISGVTVNNGLITVSAATEGSDINITNTVINVTDDAGYGIYDSTSKSIEKITASGVTVNFNGTGAHFSDAINCAVPGVTVNVYKTQTTTGVTTIANGVTVNVYESITGDITNDGQVNILAEDATVNIIDGTGSTDTSGVLSEAKLSGELRTDSTFTDRQIVTVNDNLTLVSGTQLVIQGKLVIHEGITITIQDGAQLIIDGQAASVENDGSIIVQSSKQDVTDGKTGVQEYESTVGGLVIASGVFVNNGSIIGAYTDEDAETPVAVKVIEISADAVVKNNGSIEIGIESDIEILGTL